jgi:protein tyrosine phosphatase
MKNGVDFENARHLSYINASYVNSPFEKVGAEGSDLNGDAKLIACQGPLEQQKDHIW